MMEVIYRGDSSSCVYQDEHNTLADLITDARRRVSDGPIYIRTPCMCVCVEKSGISRIPVGPVIDAFLDYISYYSRLSIRGDGKLLDLTRISELR